MTKPTSAWWLAPLATAGLVALVSIGLSLLVTTCHTRRAGELTGTQRRATEQASAASVQAGRRDSTRGRAHLDTASTHLAQGRTWADSATHYAIRPTPVPADSGAVRRFFANYFGW